MELGNVFFIITGEITTDGAGRSHLPWAVFVLRHFCAGRRAGNLIAVWEPSRIWWGSVTCEPPAWCLAGSTHTSEGAGFLGGGGGAGELLRKGGPGERRAPTSHSKLLAPYGKCCALTTRKVGLNSIGLLFCMWEICFCKYIFLCSISFKPHNKRCL